MFSLFCWFSNSLQSFQECCWKLWLNERCNEFRNPQVMERSILASSETNTWNKTSGCRWWNRFVIKKFNTTSPFSKALGVFYIASMHSILQTIDHPGILSNQYFDLCFVILKYCDGFIQSGRLLKRSLLERAWVSNEILETRLFIHKSVFSIFCSCCQNL